MTRRGARTDSRGPRGPAGIAAALPLAAARSDFVLDVRRALFGACGVAPGEAIVVGVSGGADSMALMLALAAIAWRSARSRGIRPVVVHVHHHLRGRAADLDAAFVGREAGRLELPFELRHVRPAEVPGSTAAAARRLRYAALAEVARARGARSVAVAHHADDQAESILMALARGAGLAGLGGMAPWRPLQQGGQERDGELVEASSVRAADELTLVRPLLELDKSQCEDFCRQTGRRWRRDASNEDRTSPRVRLRQEVLPVLESLWPGAIRRAGTTARVAREAHLALSAQARSAAAEAPGEGSVRGTPGRARTPTGPANRPAATRPGAGGAARASRDLATSSAGEARAATTFSRHTLLALPEAVVKMLIRREHAELVIRSGQQTKAGPTAGARLAARHLDDAIRLITHGRPGNGLAWPGGVHLHLSKDAVLLQPSSTEGAGAAGRSKSTRAKVSRLRRGSRTDSKTSRPRIADTR